MKKTNKKAVVAHNRQAVLDRLRALIMARSAHAYVRGNTAQFYEWLAEMSVSSLPIGPAIWICGDCHVGNLGPISDAKGNVQICIRDFDQAVIGNPAHDLIRLGLSLAMEARGSNLPGVTTALVLENLVHGYMAALKSDDLIPTPTKLPKIVRKSLREAKGRNWRDLAKDRTKGTTESIELGKRFWPITASERHGLESLVKTNEIHTLATQVAHRKSDDPVRFLDAAYWRKGCSSLGLPRYAILLDVGKRASKGRGLCLIDVKGVVPSVAPVLGHSDRRADGGARVAEGARQMTPSLGNRLIGARLGETDVFVRELRPQDLKLEFGTITPKQARQVAAYLAGVVGQAHARQLSRPDRQAWLDDLTSNWSSTVETPSWLWRSVVELVALHEKGYLEHCRRYALANQ